MEIFSTNQNHSVNLNLKGTRLLRENLHSTERYVCNIGGKRSSKSYSVSQTIALRFIDEKFRNKKFIVTRKTFPSLRQTAYKSIINHLVEWGFYHERNHNKTEHTYKYGTNEILFLSIDNPQKIRSYEANYVWCEEANELTQEDFLILDLQLSGKTFQEQPNQIFLTYNPSDEYSWIRKIETNKQTKLIHSTYLDNPFLDNVYVSRLEQLSNEDSEAWKMWGLGEYVTLSSIIYTNWDVVEKFPDSFEKTIYGLDFGFNNPSVLAEINFKDGEIYEREIIYETKLTNAMLIEKMNALNVSKVIPIYADSEDPARIEDIRRAGYSVFGVDKKDGSVVAGIESVKKFKTHILADSINAIEEKKSYKWMSDKNGVLSDKKPLKFNDHFCDAERYAIFSDTKNKSFNYGFFEFGFTKNNEE